MKITYKHLEHLHHQHGIMLHSSVFLFSLLLGIGIGILAFTVNTLQSRDQKEKMKQYEAVVMDKIVQKIEATPLVLPTIAPGPKINKNTVK